jgi:hypothetical protein
MVLSLTEIVVGLTKLGVNITGKQYETIKWRISAEAQRYYTEKENKIFYKSLSKGDLRVVDAIRKEKQERIDRLKKRYLSKSSAVSILLLCIMTSCNTSIPKVQEAWDVNSLQEKEKTYQLKEQAIKVKGELGAVRFTEEWYVVSEDFIKQSNENQDALLAVLEKIDEAAKDKEKTQRIILFSIVGGVLLILVIVVIVLIRRKNSEYT